MSLARGRARLEGYLQRQSASLLFRRPLTVAPERPLISFTFDDFPRSALLTGGTILNRAGLAGTYFASLGLMDQDAPTGRIFGRQDLPLLLEQGHELGCHTFSHCHSWDTSPTVFEHSVVENRDALRALVPGLEFRTHAYPISAPRPGTKSRMGHRFLACRGGGQTFNTGTADLNHLAAFFLEKIGHDLGPVKDVIDRNREARGWLIFATHDVDPHPTPFGCRPEFFEEVVAYAAGSGASILTLAGALDLLKAPSAYARPS